MEYLFESCLCFLIKHFNYKIAFALTMFESTLVPVLIPIELTLIIIGYMAKIHNYNIINMITIFSLAILLGSTLNYITGKYLGRPFILKYGKYFLIKEKRFLKMEELFLKYSAKILFIGRFIPIPGIKHIITLPAGIAEMKISNFLIPTILGAIISVSFYTAIGYYFGIEKSKHIFANFKIISIAIVIILILLISVKQIRSIVNYIKSKI